MKKILLKGLTIGVLCIGCIGASVFAAPKITSVTGPISHGASITITGTDFGIKSPAAPYLWADFESGTLGGSVDGYTPTYGPAIGYSSVGPGGPVPGTFSSVNVRDARSTKHAYLDANPDLGNWSARLEIPVSRTSGEKVYVRFWHKLFFANGIPGADLNTKPFEFYNSSFQDQLYIGYGDSNGALRSGGEASTPTLTPNASINEIHDLWTGYEEEIKLGSGSNGSRRLWRHRASSIALLWSNQSMSTWQSGDDYAWFTIGDYFDRGPMEYSIDDVYVDYTWARVEIGDAPTWVSCTRREIQIPSAWSNASITVTVNQGAFQNLGGAYLYVVDANGDVNQNGYALCTACPMPPVLTVQ